MNPTPLHRLPDHTDVILAAADRCAYAAWKAGNLAYGKHQFTDALSHYRTAARLGLALGARDAGRMLLEGIGIPSDHVAALPMFEHGAELGCRESAFQAGRILMLDTHGRTDQEQGRRYLEAAAINRHIQAEVFLAYLDATGTVPCMSHGENLLRLLLLAKQGNACADHAAGLYLQSGLAGPVDPTSAFAHVKRAADAGHDAATTKIGIALLHGIGTEPDPKRGIELLLLQADHDPVAAWELGRQLINGACGGQVDLGHHYIKLAAEHGHAGASLSYSQYLLAHDQFDDGIRFLEIAVKNGVDGAAETLVRLLDNVDGLSIEDNRIRRMLEAAAPHGSPDVWRLLANYWLHHGDSDVGVFWLVAGLEEGDLNSAYDLGRELLDGRRVPKDQERGFGYLTFADRHGSHFAANYLGHFFMGNGDEDKAVSMYRKAAVAGNMDAALSLSRILILRGDVVEGHYWLFASGMADYLDGCSPCFGNVVPISSRRRSGDTP